MLISHGSDRNFHCRLAVARKAADEVVLTLDKLDPIFSGLIDFRSSWGRARIISRLVDSYHVVCCRTVVEHCKQKFNANQYTPHKLRVREVTTAASHCVEKLFDFSFLCYLVTILLPNPFLGVSNQIHPLN
jgi:hypothetical protein